MTRTCLIRHVLSVKLSCDGRLFLKPEKGTDTEYEDNYIYLVQHCAGHSDSAV